MKTKYILTFITLLILFSNCFKKIDINVPDQEQKVVINGIFASDSTLIINISKTVGINDPAQFLPRISDAVVKLYKNGIYVEDLIYKKDGSYISASIIKANENYSLVITADGKTFNVDIQMPTKKKFKELSFIKYDTVNNYYKLHLKFDDSISKNYYMINGYLMLPYTFYGDTGQIDSVTFVYNSIYFESFSDQDPYFKNPVSIYPYIDNSFMFNDELFNGNTFDLTFKLSNFFYVDTSMFNIDSLTLFFKLIQIDENIYNYFISYNKYRSSNGNPFVEPVNVFSNIEGGIGTVGGMSITLDSLKIPYIDAYSNYMEFKK